MITSQAKQEVIAAALPEDVASLPKVEGFPVAAPLFLEEVLVDAVALPKDSALPPKAEPAKAKACVVKSAPVPVKSY